MTTEEKAKAYDEALKRAKEVLSGEGEWNMSDLYEVKPAVEFIFPELAESEDERIRRMCISAVNITASADGGLLHSEASECLAWLEEQKDKNCLACDQHLKGYLAGRKVTEEEKQKENPKSADSIPSDCVSNVKCVNRWYKVEDFLPDNGRDVLAKDALGNYLIANYDGDRWYISGYDNEDKPIVYTPAIKEWCDIPSEKQKEQTLDLPAGFYFIDKNGKKYYTDTLKCGNLKFIANQKEQKPSWSEEDLEHIKSIIHRTEVYGGNCLYGRAKEDLEWLKNLLNRFLIQPKQEWSEEDRRTIDRACVALRAYANGELPDILPSEILEYADKLQSLRPSWKPSEEQMEALEIILRYGDKKSTHIKNLTSLYNQLKKLM